MTAGPEKRKHLTVSVVVPVFNESATLAEVVVKVRAAVAPAEIMIVDDGSTDGTAELVRELAAEDVRVLRHAVNQGKGACLRDAFAEVRGDVVLVQDADLEYDPADIPRLLEPIFDGQADVVYGSRFARDGKLKPLTLQRIGNAVLTFCSNRITGLELTDMECGYKVFRREVLDSLQVREKRFGVEPEITAKIARAKWRIVEVPISFAGRKYSEGKKIGLKDAFRALWCIVRYRLGD